MFNDPVKSSWILWVLLLCLVFVSAVILTPQPTKQTVLLDVGEKVWNDIRSDYDFTVIDIATTDKRKKQAEESLLPVYDYDSRLQTKLEQRLTAIFNEWRQIMRDRRLHSAMQPDITFIGPPRPLALQTPVFTDLDKTQLEEDYRLFIANSGLKVSKEIFQLLQEMNFKFNIEQPFHNVLSHICSFAIVGNMNMLKEQANRGLNRRDMYTQDERVIHNLDTIISLDVAYREIDDSAARLLSDNQLIQDIVAEIIRSLITPNLTYNMQETEKRKRIARESVKPVFFQVAAGEIIIKAGERVTPEIKLRLDQLTKLGKESRLGLIFFGNLFIFSLLACLVVFDIRKFYPNLDKNRMILIGLIAFIEIFLCKAFIVLATVIPGYMTIYPMDTSAPYRFAAPFALGSMLIALLVNEKIGVFFSFVFGIVAALMFDYDFLVGIFVVFSGYAAVFAVSHYKQRTMIIQGGFLVSIANIVVITVLQLIQADINGLLFAFSALMGLVSGLLVAMIVTILLPILESIFKIPTDIRLLELSNFNEPLLRKLAIYAPGTHHHSLMVADLAETAAEAIGANSLLAKVGAYYHDIGKIGQPDYFIENCQGDNPHDKLTPNMSSMIIRKHVKSGVEMAQKAGLGTDIIDIIEQHHGDSLMLYFFSKAMENSNGDIKSSISEDGFRYPGPCPKSKEAAIVLIADSVEAAARSMKIASASSMKSMVEKVTDSKIRDHQLDDCELTFHELTIITQSLYDCLLRKNHNRIEYPGFDFSEKKQNEDSPTDKVGNESTTDEEREEEHK